MAFTFLVVFILKYSHSQLNTEMNKTFSLTGTIQNFIPLNSNKRFKAYENELISLNTCKMQSNII